MDQENNTTSNRAAGKSTAATSAWRNSTRARNALGVAAIARPTTLVRLQTKDRGGAVGITTLHGLDHHMRACGFVKPPERIALQNVEHLDQDHAA